MRKTVSALIIMLATSSSTTTHAQDVADHTSFAAPADIKAEVSAMFSAMTPGQTFKWQPLLKDGSRTAALEIWKAPGRPAVHVAEAEYFTVVQGSGVLVTGGHMVNPHQVNAGMLDGDTIEGGTTRALKVGDTVLIPAGHRIGLGFRGAVVLLGIKIPSAPGS